MPRATKRCGRKGCDEKMPCATHKPIDRRPPARQRYPSSHDVLRRQWAKRLAELWDRGEAWLCRRDTNGTCLEDDPVIAPGSRWDLGHPDEECPAPTAPEHRRCNRATAGRAGRRTV